MTKELLEYIDYILDDMKTNQDYQQDDIARQVVDYVLQFFPQEGAFKNTEQTINIYVYTTESSHIRNLLNIQSLLMNYIVKRRIRLSVGHPFSASHDCQYIQKLGFVVKAVKQCDCYIQLGQPDEMYENVECLIALTRGTAPGKHIKCKTHVQLFH